METRVDHRLPNGLYPFASVRLPLSQMTMTEAPLALEAVLRRAADDGGVEIVRDHPVELRCTSQDYPDATFVVFWPEGDECLHVQAPVESVCGRA